ncbi:MAG: M1 family peptidase, partial [Ginsengibacter sp.]
MKNLLVVCVALICTSANAQTESSTYDPHDLFTPNFYPSSVNEFRAADGTPGPKYWANKASYKIAASLDDVKDEIKGTVTITYVNNSPQELSYLWLYLDEDLYDLESRGQAKTPATRRSRYGDVNSTFKGGYDIQSVQLLSSANGKTPIKSLTKIISDTRMQLRLSSPLAANGGTIQFKIDYSYLIPKYG